MSLQTRRSILKAWNISSAIAWVAPDSLKSMTILSDTTFRRSAVEQEDLKPYWKYKKAEFLEVIHKPVIWIFSKDFTNHQMKTSRMVVVTVASPQKSWIHGPQMTLSNNLENKIPSNTYWIDELSYLRYLRHQDKGS